MDRRSFLQLGGCGALSLASGSIPGLASTAASLIAAPPKPVILSSPQLQVVLDPDRGLPYEYRFANGARLRGDQTSKRISATICQFGPWKFSDVDVVSDGSDTNTRQCEFRFKVVDATEQKSAARFALRYVLQNATLFVTLENVHEHAGYELIDVKMPRLVTVYEQDGNGWLAHGDDGGNLAQLHEATLGSLRPNSFWGNVQGTLPVVMVGTDRALCVQEVTAFMDGTQLKVEGDPGKRVAALGTIKTFRVNASECYNMNLPKGSPCVSGKPGTPNLIVGQKSACRLDFIAAAPKRTANWLDGAKSVRQRMPKIPTDYYDKRFVYGIRLDEPTWEKPAATFDEAEQIIRDIASLTDGWAQVAHLWGWQYKGKDTGYPAIDEVDQRIGGYDGLMKLMEAGRKINCNVTFSDNYDDAYRSSPDWNDAYIARRPDQELWKSRNWTGEDSYILGMAKYTKMHGLARVDRTCEKYRLRDTTHVDVLSYFAVRNDWDAANPASGYKNLIEGRYKILEQFAKHGIDVSSEAVRYPFIGKISFYWTANRPGTCPFGGTPIPMLNTIYRNSAIWGQGGSRGELIDELLNTFFYNGQPHVMWRANTDRRQITDLFYLAIAPWFRLHKRNIEGFQRDGDRTIIELEGNSRIDLDWKAKTYLITADGVEIARTLATFCPLGDDRIAFYSQQPNALSAALPAGWDPTHVTAFALSTANPEPVATKIESGKITVHVPAQKPVIVYRKSPTELDGRTRK